MRSKRMQEEITSYTRGDGHSPATVSKMTRYMHCCQSCVTNAHARRDCTYTVKPRDTYMFYFEKLVFLKRHIGPTHVYGQTYMFLNERMRFCKLHIKCFTIARHVLELHIGGF